jgi:hypothetical protein
MAGTAGTPLLPAQVVQQRQLLFEVFQILIHRAILIMEIVGTGQPPGRSGRKRCIATSAPALSGASREEKWQRSRPALLSALILSSHIRILPDERSKGNPDPSRALAPAGADTSRCRSR